MKKRIRIQGFLIFLAIALVVLSSRLIFPNWKQEPLDEFLDALGMILVLFGFLFRISARGYKEEKSAGGTVLVKDGLYSVVKNPMYFGTLMIGTGIIVVLFDLWALPIFLAIFIFIYIPQIKKEEAILSNRFGEEYKEYSRKVPAFLPHPHSLLSIKVRTPLKSSSVKKEFFSFIAVIFVIIAIEIWEDMRSFGYKELYKEFLELCIIIIAFIILTYFSSDKNNLST